MVKCSVWRDGRFVAIHQRMCFFAVFAVHTAIWQVSRLPFFRHPACYFLSASESKLIKFGCQKENAMLLIPNAAFDDFTEFLCNKGFSGDVLPEYIKWLRYYLDFCNKYPVPDSKPERVRLFAEKLREKKQTVKQRERAAHAVSLYFEMQKGNRHPCSQEVLPPVVKEFGGDVFASQNEDISPPAAFPRIEEDGRKLPAFRRTSNYFEAGYALKTDSPEWDALLAALAGEIKLRHYSRKTLKTYANWSRRFQSFLKNKLPQELMTADVKDYLTYLAVTCKVAASTQNQAFNSLLFLFRHGLKREFGELRDVPRAKKSLYIPMVLSRPEIDAILKQLSYPYNLVVKVLFGCGLRLFECLQMRVGDFNFDAGMLLVHGKGKKDRTVPIPESIASELKAQIIVVGELHDRDLAVEYDGVFMDDEMEKKYPNAPKEFINQWFFPQQALTVVAETNERRRYHLHESQLQEALYFGVRRAKIPKKVTAHTFRHSYA
ncbi:MAG: hypothetical protein ACD_36C00008G0001, partial [uncultured bacterium]